MIKWEKGSSVITWTHEDHGIIVQNSAIFGPEGTPESSSNCYRILMEDWVQIKPTRAEQWALIKDDFELVWDTLEIVFGMSKIKSY